jgi:hypothetical protein
MLKYWNTIILLLFAVPCIANANFHFNAEAKDVYENILNGKTITAKESISAYKKQQPENLIWHWLEDYNEFINLYFSESEIDFKKYVTANETRIAALKKGNTKNEWYNYTLAENYLHLAFAQFMFEEYVSGFWNMRKAYQLLEENNKAYPNFTANQKNMALIQALTGILPEKYHWILNLFGVEANLEKGTATLKKLATTTKNNFDFSNETKLMYGILLFHTSDNREQALQFFQQQKFPSEENLIGNIAAINLMLHSNKNEMASELLKKTPTSKEYPKVALVEYLKGLQQLQILNGKIAANHFRNYLLQTKSKHLIKSSYHKIAWCSLINNDISAYQKNIAEITKSGKATREADKQAEREAENNKAPNTDLLKARLQFDAGDYENCIAILNKTNEKVLNTAELSTEFIYRKARTYDKLKDHKKAIQYYTEVIAKGEKLPYYFAANAALHLGYIYEQQGDKKKATQYFEKCISLQHHEYANSLTQKAKSALKRLNP